MFHTLCDATFFRTPYTAVTVHQAILSDDSPGKIQKIAVYTLRGEDWVRWRRIFVRLWERIRSTVSYHEQLGLLQTFALRFVQTF